MACNPSSPEVKAEKSEVQGHPRPIQKIPGQFGIQETLFKKVVWRGRGEKERECSVLSQCGELGSTDVHHRPRKNGSCLRSEIPSSVFSASHFTAHHEKLKSSFS